MKRDGKLKQFRKAYGYTQDKMAERLNVKRSQIAMYETGERRPSVSFLLKLKETFDLSYEWIGEYACEVAREKNDSRKNQG